VKGKAVTVHDNTFMGPRICTRCGGNVDFGQPCQECLAWYYDAAPKFDEMTDEERATEILSWEFAEIGFDLTYLRIEELLGRELFKHRIGLACCIGQCSHVWHHRNPGASRHGPQRSGKIHALSSNPQPGT